MFELPRSKSGNQTLTRKSITGSSSNLSSPRKENEDKSDKKVRISSKDDSAVSEFQSRSVSPRKVGTNFLIV